MDFRDEASVRVSPEAVWAAVRDLSTYPSWFSIVDRASAGGDAAWQVELGARVGPFKRTKRVRMVRVLDDAAAHHVRFERDERDGERHSEWILDAQVVNEDQNACSVRVHLHYSGIAWLPGLDLILSREARNAGPRLERLLWRE